MEDTCENEDDVIGCMPRVLPSSHRDEILQLILGLGILIDANNQSHLERNFERFVKLIDLYLEQPVLLDCIIPKLVDLLLTYVTLPSGSIISRLDNKSSAALNYLACIAKARGYKIIARLLPHQVSYLDRVILCLEAYSETPSSDLCERRVLLYWLWILCKNPFDFARFDTLDNPGRTLERIMKVGLSNIFYKELNKEAALVISHCLSRKDGLTLLTNMVDFSITTLRDLNHEPLSFDDRNKLAGCLALLLAMFKHVDRIHLTSYAETLYENICQYYPVHHNCDDIGKKLVKLCQRLALVLLRPKLASWRYSRGQRRLEDNLTENVCCEPGNGHIENKLHSETDTDVVHDVDGEDIHSMVEWAVSNLLQSLTHDSTGVRWSAAKGIGRIASRLPKYLACQVANSILDDNFDPYNSNSSWHGGCMAIAELSRKGCLLPDIFEKVFPIVRAALFYEEPMGHHALGGNVRDAACYVLWSFGRAYDPSQLTIFVNQMASSLMCASLFDREVSIRRAASAAFQENVGRQSNFPNGISLLTVVDYFSVGVRRKCYTELVREVVVYPEYADELVDHLIEKKIVHWDKTMRDLAGDALRCLAPLHPVRIESKLTMLLDELSTVSPVKRHGYLTAICNIVEGLLVAGIHINDAIMTTVANIPQRLKNESLAPKSSGGEITRIAICEYMYHLATSRMDLKYPNIVDWNERIESCAKDHTRNVQQMALEASGKFHSYYLLHDESGNLGKTLSEKYCKEIANASDECIRIGVCGLAASLPMKYCSADVFSTLCSVVSAKTRNKPDYLWAMARAAAVRSAVNIYCRSKNDNWTETILQTLFIAMEDYTENQHGEIGRHVRQQAMISFVEVFHSGSLALPCPSLLMAVRKMIQQSGQKIGRTRECAASCLSRLLSIPQLDSYVPSSNLLKEIYADSTFFIQDASLLTLSPLLKTEYYEDVLCSVILSGGGVSDVTTKYAGRLVLEFQATIMDDLQELERFLQSVSQLFSAGMKCMRIAKGVLNFLPQILNRLPTNSSFVDNSKSLSEIIKRLDFILCRFNNSPARIRIVLQCFSSLLGSDTASRTFQFCVQRIASQLSHSTPSIRSFAAESLYEAICLSEVADSTLEILSETPWLSTCEADKSLITESAEKIQLLFI